MRIGLFTDTYTPDINGVVSSIVTLQKELERNGHDVFIIANHKAMTMKQEGNVLRLPGLELKWLYGYKLSTPYHFSARDEIRKMNLDVIHVHTEFGVGFFARLVAKNLNIPVVSTYHTMYEDYTHYVNRFEIGEVDKVSKKFVSAFSRLISDNVQAVIAPSEKTKEALIKYGVKRPIYIIPTGLNFESFDMTRIDPEEVKQIRQSYGIQENDHVIVFVGRIAKEKSIDIPIEGFRYIKNKHIKLMIVGGGPQLEELKEMVHTYHLKDQVIFTDKKTREEVPKYYACADCFVSASLSETQGMTYIEALASDLPVFARYDDVLKELVVEGDSGYIFETAEEFAKKLENFFEKDKTEIDAMRIRAHEKIMKYDSRVFCSKVLSVYYQAIDDYQEAYEVIKIKTYDDYVRIYIVNEKEDEPIKVALSFDDYFVFKIRLHMMLDRHTIEDFQHKEIVLNAYRSAVRKLKMRDYTRKEMQLYFNRQVGLSNDDIVGLIDELEEKGYLNDQLYIASKIDKMQHTLIGKGNVRRTLINKGVDVEAVDLALAQIDDEDESIRALKMAQKLVNTVKDKSRKMKEQTIVKKLISLGFEHDIAIHAANEIEFENDDSAALIKTIQKAIRNYSRRYKGKQLHDKVLMYCLQKGFVSDHILEKLNEMEWHDE